MATLTVPELVPSPAEDCKQLRMAFAGSETNERLIVSILAHRTASQRRLIRQTYSEKYGEDLLESLAKEISGDFERAVRLWTWDPAERDAFLANEEAWWDHDRRVLIEISCARTSGELLAARQAHHARFKRSLEEDVAAHTSGDLRKLFVALVSSFRYEGKRLSKILAGSEAKTLHEKITEKAFNHDEVIRIITTRSKAQLIETFKQYKNSFGNPINKDLKSDPRDEFLMALRATIRCITCPERYFEKVIRLALNKVGAFEGALTRVITTRAEVDLKEIKEIYDRRNIVPLNRAIAKDTCGDYESMLLALLGHDEACAFLRL